MHRFACEPQLAGRDEGMHLPSFGRAQRGQKRTDANWLARHPPPPVRMQRCLVFVVVTGRLTSASGLASQLAGLRMRAEVSSHQSCVPGLKSLPLPSLRFS